MATNDHLSGDQFSHEKQDAMHIINATHNGRDVGELTWADHRGIPSAGMRPHEVGAVYVVPQHPGKGVASQMRASRNRSTLTCIIPMI